jgi:excisionase family DNA binding protein
VKTLNVSQAAFFLGVSERTIINYLHEGRIGSHSKKGNRWLIPEVELLKFEKKNHPQGVKLVIEDLKTNSQKENQTQTQDQSPSQNDKSNQINFLETKRKETQVKDKEVRERVEPLQRIEEKSSFFNLKSFEILKKGPWLDYAKSIDHIKKLNLAMGHQLESLVIEMVSCLGFGYVSFHQETKLEKYEQARGMVGSFLMLLEVVKKVYLHDKEIEESLNEVNLFFEKDLLPSIASLIVCIEQVKKKRYKNY